MRDGGVVGLRRRIELGGVEDGVARRDAAQRVGEGGVRHERAALAQVEDAAQRLSLGEREQDEVPTLLDLAEAARREHVTQLMEGERVRTRCSSAHGTKPIVAVNSAAWRCRDALPIHARHALVRKRGPVASRTCL